MEPSPVQTFHVSSFSSGGPAGIWALLVGIAVLVLGIVVARRRGPQWHAHALFAAAWLPLPIGLFGKAAGEVAAFNEVVRLGPALTPNDLAHGLAQASAATACALLAILFGLAGAIAALARSRENVPPAV